MQELQTKEITVAKQQATKALGAAEQLTIKTAEDLTSATEMLSKVNKVGDIIKSRKEEITKPMNAALKSVRDFFRPLETSQENADNIIKRKMIDYHNAEAAKQKAEEDKIEKRVEKGTMKMETGMAKIEKIQEQAPQKSLATKSGSVQFKEVKVVKVTDANLIPGDYLGLDMV